ncbi:hypothetical protein E1281_36310 [Actinomadura sp. KC345]|uniref:hypothetical protein n=1 Tax=Actinomadura sp. KC345 TaxID=2530371 RepID=UPI001052EAEA|nr:hypothetical protein [Actinomadura sp. KC345]TDC42317.1 hypothetical protein E1281_36310 [Actinomadura sp. KC345]
MLLPRMAAVAGAAVAGAVVVTAMTAPAHAAPAPTYAYTCDRTFTGNKHRGMGWLNCAAPPEAPRSGPIDGTFLIQSREGSGPKLKCTKRPPDYFPAGHANLPESVTGTYCKPL